MVLEFLINLFGNIAIFLINLLPDFPNLGNIVGDTFQSIYDVFHAVGFLVNLQVVGICLMALIIFYNIEFVFAAVMWIIRKIPGVS